MSGLITKRDQIHSYEEIEKRLSNASLFVNLLIESSFQNENKYELYVHKNMLYKINELIQISKEMRQIKKDEMK